MDEKETFRTSDEFSSHPYEGMLEDFTSKSRTLISEFLLEEAVKNRLKESDLDKYDTFILPSVQMGPLNIRQVGLFGLVPL